MTFVILNGDAVEAEKASVSINDRGLILGDGLFETMRAYNGRVFRMEDHLERMYEGLEAMNIRPPWNENDLTKMTRGLIDKNRLTNARVRITVTRGEHEGSMGTPPSDSPTLFITAAPLPEGLSEKMGEGVKLAEVSIKFSAMNPTMRIKTLNRVPHLMARQEAVEKGADEALILDERGNVAACSTGNLFVVQYGQLFTCPLKGAVLAGVTRKAAIELADDQGIPLREDFFSPIVFAGAEEAFMTNSVQEIVPVLEVDGRPVSSGRPGPVTIKLRKLYRELAEER